MTQQILESTTQKYLDIYDITDDVLILKDGSSSVVVTVNAMNFGLLAEPEQDAIMYSYAGLLNSLNYPIQIVIRSQTKDVTSYLNLLKDEQEKSTSDLKRGWIERYRGFVSELIKERNVLDKKFYVVISATSLEMGMLPPSSVIPGTAKVDLSTVERSVILDKAKEILEPRKDHLLGQFGRIGLYGHQLTTQELIQLFYLSYNPEAAEGQQITDTLSYTTPLVQASVQGGIMDSSNQKPNPASAPSPSAPAASTPAPALGEKPMTPSAPASTPPAPSMPSSTPPATPSPMPSTPPTSTAPTTPVTPSSLPKATPTPGAATPTSTPAPTTPIPGAAPSGGIKPDPAVPSITKPATPSSNPMPAKVTPAPATPAKASADPVTDSAQNEIDSTLKELGSIGSTPAAPASSPTPTASPTTPPIATGSGSAGSDQKSNDKASGDMPPLPEI